MLTTHRHRSACVCVQQQDDVMRRLTGERQADHLAGQLERAGAVHRPRPLDAGAALPDPRHGCVGPGDGGGRPGRTHLHAGCHTLPCDAVPPLRRSREGEMLHVSDGRQREQINITLWLNYNKQRKALHFRLLMQSKSKFDILSSQNNVC